MYFRDLKKVGKRQKPDGITSFCKAAKKEVFMKFLSIFAFFYGLTGVNVAYAESQFDTAKSDIKPVLLEELDKLCEKIDSDSQLIIEGHTDVRGGEIYNLRLSKKRAESVKNYLLQKCPNKPQSIRTIGMGKEYPVSKRHSENRRVVVHVYGEKVRMVYVIRDHGQKVVVESEKSSKKEHKQFLSLIGTAGTAARLKTEYDNNGATVRLSKEADFGVLYQYKPESSNLIMGVGGTFMDPAFLFSVGIGF